MKNNYNDIIDILMTLLNDEEIASSIVVSGTIVPFLVTKKEPDEYIRDFSILVKKKNIDSVRKKVKNLSKEYTFDIVSDSKTYTVGEYGFKIKYNDTNVRFEPYSFLSNNFKVSSYALSEDEKEIITKTNTLYNVTKNCIIRYTTFSDDKKIRIISPEYQLSKIELMNKKAFGPSTKVIEMLNRLSDESILKIVREKMENENVDIKRQAAKKDNQMLFIILGAVLVVLAMIVFLIIK